LILTFTTFNVQRGRRPDRVIDVPLLAAACAAIEWDVLALQELTADQTPAIAEATGQELVFGPAIPGYGNALLSRSPITDVDVVDLPYSQEREPRAAILARTSGVTVAATHLGLRGDARLQLPVLLAALLARPAPHVLLGDLNVEDPDAAPLELVRSSPTFPAHRPRRTIDHVAVRGLDVRSARVLGQQLVGDHRPLAVTAEHRE
jgi:endonuclease/exonuclease/phosphatase family metal-dependent hydrolase